MLQLTFFNVTNGLIIGAFYVLMALGLSLILNLSGRHQLRARRVPGHRRLSRLHAAARMSASGRAARLAAPDGAARTCHRAPADPPLYGRDPLYSLLLTFGLAFIFEDADARDLGRDRASRSRCRSS